MNDAKDVLTPEARAAFDRGCTFCYDQGHAAGVAAGLAQAAKLCDERAERLAMRGGPIDALEASETEALGCRNAIRALAAGAPVPEPGMTVERQL